MCITLLPYWAACQAVNGCIAEALGQDLRHLAYFVYANGAAVHHPDRVFTKAVIDLTLDHNSVNTWLERLIRRQLDAPSTRGALRGAVPFANGNAYLDRVRTAVFNAVRILSAERTEARALTSGTARSVSFKTRNVSLQAADRLRPMVRELLVEDFRVEQRSEDALEWLDSLGCVAVFDPQAEAKVDSGHEIPSLISSVLFAQAVHEAKLFGFADTFDPAEIDHLMELASILEQSYSRGLAFRIRAELHAAGSVIQARTYFFPDSDIAVAEEIAWCMPAIPDEYVGTVHLPYRP